MKLNKILSSALLVVMIFTSFAALIPVKAEAAYVSTESGSATKTESEIVQIVEYALNNYKFETAEEMLAYELENGYLDSITSNGYTVYVNKYTGVLYYKNNLTGQILTSNPTYYDSKVSDAYRKLLLSQIEIKFSEISKNSSETYNSTVWAALRAQISTEFISDGIRVNYTIGDTTTRYLLPGRMKADKYEALILKPMLEKIVSCMEEYCVVEGEEYNGEYDIFNNPEYNVEEGTDSAKKRTNVYYKGYLNSRAIKTYLTSIEKIYTKVLAKNSPELKELSVLKKDITTMLSLYTLKNPGEYDTEELKTDAVYQNLIDSFYTLENGDIAEDLSAMYVYKVGEISDKVKSDDSICFRKYCGSYTIVEMYADEKECRYVDAASQKPTFRCALEYSIDEDGALSVRLPASSISFDDTVYNLESITTLKYFGAGDMTNDGYIFYPDGSGTVLEFEDVYNDVDKFSANLAGNIYGNDYCYSNITGAHREQISMPVFGIVNDDKANATTTQLFGVDKVTNGYFAIIEEGESLASLGFQTGGSYHQFASAFCTYNPYPSDKYNLSETLSVSGLSKYTIVAESKYTGSYVTKFVMLTDSVVGDKLVESAMLTGYYPSTYVGMANYYRDYLKANGTLSNLELTSTNLPLYIEVLGSMEITTKVLSFPVSKDIPLTSFDDILTMYNEISNASETFEKKAQEYEALAAEMQDEAIAAEYRSIAEDYRTLKTQVGEIKNINFRLTGFGKGGMYSTYPTKVKWSKACGGKRDFKKLVAEAKSIADTNGVTFGIYPEYDFVYINNTSAFDGIRIKGNVSRMVDNRYASKQEYSSIMQEYQSYFTLVVNPESLEKLYNKFVKQYDKYRLGTISVSTLGSDINSNFDKDESVNRDEAQDFVCSVLENMSSKYNVMTDIGNVYSLKYVDHILNASIDSSHFRYSSYTVPFVGMVIHGSVSYAGKPLNYSGAPQYDILRAIESGASLYYILCYQNSSYMKEDSLLSSYYGVDYATWFENVVTTYKTLNDEIGGLQGYYIIDHRIIKGERVIEESELNANYKLLTEELVELLDTQIFDSITKKYAELQAAGEAGLTLTVIFDEDALYEQFASILGFTVEDLKAYAFSDDENDTFVNAINAVFNKYRSEYPANNDETKNVVVNVSSIEDYDEKSKYSFITESLGTDSKYDYDYTDYTSDNGNIVLVTYYNGTETHKFVLNYNLYEVEIKLDGVETFVLPKYGYRKI